MQIFCKKNDELKKGSKSEKNHFQTIFYNFFFQAEKNQ